MFAELYASSYKAKYEEAGIWYEHRLIDDMVAQVKRHGRAKLYALVGMQLLCNVCVVPGG